MGDIRRLRSSAVWIVLIVASCCAFGSLSSTTTMRQRTVIFLPSLPISRPARQKLMIGEDSEHAGSNAYIDPDTNDAKSILPGNTTIYEALLEAYGVDVATAPPIDVKAASRWGSWLGALRFPVADPFPDRHLPS
ncbi:MAG: hypothetical protein R2855_10740 [Thermomicrobiales bacterium]